jgi:hypothetical protein
MDYFLNESENIMDFRRKLASCLFALYGGQDPGDGMDLELAAARQIAICDFDIFLMFPAISQYSYLKM